MKKERIKSLVLAFLVITNIALCSKIWSNKKLWPSGYNFFSNISNSRLMEFISNIFHINNAEYASKSQINIPKQIIVNTGYQTTRVALDSTHDEFNTVNSLSQNIMKSAFSAPARSISVVEQAEWYAVLMSKSIYLNYNIQYSTNLFAQFFNVHETEAAGFTDYITDIVIATNNTSNNVVYIKNGYNDTYCKIITSVPKDETEAFIDTIQKGFSSDDNSSFNNIINYSFDLQFDKGNQKVLLSPMIPIFSNPQTYDIIKSENPIVKSDGSLNTSLTERLLSTFDINSSTMRRYTEANGTVVFVENDAILKLSPDGTLDFSATSPDSGIKLTDSISASTYTAICVAADFMDDINSEISVSKNLYLSSDLTPENVNNSSINLEFDYIVNGMPVDMSQNSIPHAVSMTISNGYLQRYTQVLRSYSKINAQTQTAAFIESLDDIAVTHENILGQIYADKIYTAYIDDGTIGEKNADWKIILGNMRS